jgi:hypothetical protein
MVEKAASRSIWAFSVRRGVGQLTTMHYAMLVYLEEPDFLAWPAEEQERLRDACADWHDALVRDGRSGGAMRLQPVATATTLRERAGGLVLSDGPFAETKEILGGFVILEAPDLDAAIALARTFPSLRAGFSLELRPVMPGGAGRGDAGAS